MSLHLRGNGVWNQCLVNSARRKQFDDRICFCASIFFTAALLLKSAEPAPVELETPTEGGAAERKSEGPVEPAAAPGPAHGT